MLGRKTSIKVVLLGDPGVGKTSLMHRFTKGTFNDTYKSLGLDFITKDVKVGKIVVNTHVWDTTGHRRFAKFWPTYYSDAECCVLVFSLMDEDSFESVKAWRSEFLEKCCPVLPREFPFVVVGNKSDLNELREVSPGWPHIPIDPGLDYPCFETSALSGHNVDQCFQTVIRQAIQYKLHAQAHPL